jgi:hypothetical protein
VIVIVRVIVIVSCGRELAEVVPDTAHPGDDDAAAVLDFGG